MTNDKNISFHYKFRNFDVVVPGRRTIHKQDLTKLDAVFLKILCVA